MLDVGSALIRSWSVLRLPKCFKVLRETMWEPGEGWEESPVLKQIVTEDYVIKSVFG